MKLLLIFIISSLVTNALGESKAETTKTETGSVNARNTSLRLSDDLFIDSNLIEENRDESTLMLSKQDSLTKIVDFNGADFSYGENLTKNSEYKITEKNGDYFLIRSNLYNSRSNLQNKSKNPNKDNFLDFDQNISIKRGERELIYLGNVKRQDGDSQNKESSLNYLHTQKFDPCTLDHNALVQIQETTADLIKQGNYKINANCVIGKRLQGDFFANVVFTDQNGEIIRKLKVEGELSLKVVEALTLKYSASYLEGEDPLNLESKGIVVRPGQLADPNQEYIPPSSIRVGQIDFFNRDLMQGALHEFSAFTKTMLKEDTCSLTNTISIKLEENADQEIQNAKIYTTSLSYSCEEGDEFTASFSNGYERNGEKVNLIELEKNFTKKDENQNSRTKVQLDVAQEVETKAWFTNFNISHSRVDASGLSQKTNFDVFYAQDSDSYVLAQHVFFFPVLSSENLALLKELSEDSETPAELKDLNLCFKISCRSLGAATTLSFDGKAFVSAEGTTPVDLLGKELDFSMTAGFSLDDGAINKGFGSNSFINNNQENFVELRLSSPDCGNENRACFGLSLRKEETSTKGTAGLKFKF